MKLPMTGTTGLIMGGVAFVLVVFIFGYIFHKISAGAKGVAALARSSKKIEKDDRGIKRNLRKEKKLDRLLRRTGKHMRRDLKFEMKMQDRESSEAKKSMYLAKRIVYLSDEQAKLWIAVAGNTNLLGRSNYQSNSEELKKRVMELQHHILEVAHKLQKEIESEKQAVAESQHGEELEKKEMVRTKQSLILERRDERLEGIKDAKSKEEVQSLRREMDIEMKKFREYNIGVQSELKMLNADRAVASMIKQLGWLLIPAFRKYSEANMWIGNGQENAQQKAHYIAFYCKKIYDTTLVKEKFLNKFRHIFKKDRKWGKKKKKLRQEATASV